MNRSWWLALLLLTAGAGLLLLPVAPAGERLRTPQRISGSLRGPEAAATYLGRRLQLFHWADSLSRVTLEGAADGAPLVVGSAADHPDAYAQDQALAEAAALALGEGFREAAVGRFKVDTEDGAPLPRSLSPTHHGEFLLAGEARGRPYCFTVTNLPAEYWTREADEGTLWPELARDASPSETLGACWVVARHGLPGPHLARWFSRGGAYFATGHTPYDLSTLVQDEFDGLAGFYVTLLGGSRLLPVRAQRCLAGHDDACASLVTEPLSASTNLIRPHTVPVPVEAAAVVAEELNRVATVLPGVVDPAFLAMLERRFGHERFRVFWTSEAPVEQAFQDAFGLSLGEHVRREAQAVMGPILPGPGLRAGGWLTAALVTLAGLGLGALVTVRRRVA